MMTRTHGRLLGMSGLEGVEGEVAQMINPDENTSGKKK